MSEQAMRDNDGKTELSYVTDFPYAMAGFSRVCEFGARKYARDNWKFGLNNDKVLDSLLRHLFAHRAGETLDRESGLSHLAHAMWNAVVLLEQQRARGPWKHEPGEGPTYDERVSLNQTTAEEGINTTNDDVLSRHTNYAATSPLSPGRAFVLCVVLRSAPSDGMPSNWRERDA